MISVKVIDATNNPHYPLPADYHELSVDGQRQARCNAARQWTLPGTSAQLADRLVASTWFFDTYYLHPDPESDFDPMFYDMAPLETPSFHWDLSRMWATNRCNVAMAPRGSAKSTHCRKDMIMRLATAPYSFVYATSTHDNSKHTGQLIKDQCYENERIQDDFGVELGTGSLRPAHGSRPRGTEYFYLENGSWLRCVSAESRLRGLRPRRFRLDDPEYDEKASTSMQKIRDYMERLLFKIAMQMVLRARCGIDWVGTFVSKRHYLWHALQTTKGPLGELRAVDPRFDLWARMFIRAARVNEETGLIESVWPDMWPTTIAEKNRLGKHESVSLEEMPAIMGTATFNGEMLGRPGDTEEQFFKLDTSPQGRHAWWLEQVDAAYTHDRWNSTALMCWQGPGGLLRKVPMGEFLRNSRLFACVDTAYTEKTTSDRRALSLMALSSDNYLFVLDQWSDRKGDAVLVNTTFEMCQTWRCPLVCIEVVKESFKIYKRFESAVQTRLTTEIGLNFTPALRALRPGTMSKTDKISTLDVRFEHALIKLPLFARYEKPWWTRMFDQIEGFNPEVDDGGLEKDDELDTVSMSLFVVKGKLLRVAAAGGDLPVLDPIEEMSKGNYTMPGGAAYGMGLSLNDLDPETMGTLLRMADERLKESSRGTRV